MRNRFTPPDPLLGQALEESPSPRLAEVPRTERRPSWLVLRLGIVRLEHGEGRATTGTQPVGLPLLGRRGFPRRQRGCKPAERRAL